MKHVQFLSLCFLVACNIKNDQLDERLKNKVNQEAEQQQIQERESQNRIAQDMERDLAIRQRLYQGSRGTFRGTLNLDSDIYRVQVDLLPTVIPYDSSIRVRSPEEVEADIQNLGYSTRIIIREASTNSIVLNCRFESIKFDLRSGSSHWISTEDLCNSSFALYLGNPENSYLVAQELLESYTLPNDSLTLQVQPSTSEAIFEVLLERVF